MSKDITTSIIVKMKRKDKYNILGDNLEYMPQAYFKSGEFLLKLLKLGYSAVEIDSMIIIRPVTIENRVLEYLIENGFDDEEYEFLINETKGLERLSIFKRFFISNLDKKDFFKLEGMNREATAKFLQKFQSIPFFEKKISEREERILKIKSTPANKKAPKGKLTRKAGVAILL